MPTSAPVPSLAAERWYETGDVPGPYRGAKGEHCRGGGRARTGERARCGAGHHSLGKFLTPEPARGWIDRIDDHDRPATDFMPTITLYHVIYTIDELNGFTMGG